MPKPMNVTQKLVSCHLVEGEITPGAEIALRVDQILLQDVLGMLAMLEFEAMGLKQVRVGLVAQYIDHNLVQADHMNADEHMFLRSACRHFGVWYSKPGNGISHPVHMARFGRPGELMVGSDSHTPAAGSLGMFAIGAGGADVVLAMAGQPIRLRMPKVRGVRVVGALPPWVSAKDAILAMLRRHGTEGGVGRIFEYHGPGLSGLSAMDRHVIANMGAEMGATTSVFPADEAVRLFLRSEERENDFTELLADDGCRYDQEEGLDLPALEPLIALPSSPGNVVPVREAAGRDIYQAYVGSSANPGYRDLAVVAAIVRGKQVHDRVSLDINPASRQILEALTAEGLLTELIRAGGRIHQAGCNGCIGMGQAPASGRISLRTVPRNFPGRSGTREDSVYLCSPETAAASALTGVITDPRHLGIDYPRVQPPARMPVNAATLVPPLPATEAQSAALEKTANIASIPELEPLGDTVELPVMLKTGDNVSTDDIVPAGTRVMPFWSNIPALGQYVYEQLDPGYAERAMATRDAGGHVIVGGLNYGQESSRENAALAPRYLGLRVAIACSFARIHWQNLVNFGVLPLTFANAAEYDRVQVGDTVRIGNLRAVLRAGHTVDATIGGCPVALQHDLSPRQLERISERFGGSVRSAGRCVGFAEATMPRPYSTDLRERALLACEQDEDAFTAVARRFRVGISTLRLWRRQAREERRRTPRPMGRGPAPLGGEATLLNQLVAERNDATLAEYADLLASRTGKPRRSAPAICRALKRLGWVRKQRRCGPANKSGWMWQPAASRGATRPQTLTRPALCSSTRAGSTPA